MMQLLHGEVVPNIDPEVERLRADNRNLQRQLADAKLEAKRAKEDAERALSMLRRQLSPLYRALQAVFGELDAAGVSEDTTTATTTVAASPQQDARIAAVWTSWKTRLSAGCGKVIDALSVHSDLNTQQLAIATGLHRTTIPKIIYDLNKAGLINKSGGRFSLKAL